MVCHVERMYQRCHLLEECRALLWVFNTDRWYHLFHLDLALGARPLESVDSRGLIMGFICHNGG